MHKKAVFHISHVSSSIESQVPFTSNIKTSNLSYPLAIGPRESIHDVQIKSGFVHPLPFNSLLQYCKNIARLSDMICNIACYNNILTKKRLFQSKYIFFD